jgi:DeoR family transcriptional regulator, fructose operon transcriptional repressor
MHDRDEVIPGLFAEERRRSILERLKASGKVTVEELVAAYAVSAPTIRADLARMEDMGLLQRTHGGAIPTSGTLFEPAYAQRQVMRHREKQAIARAGAELVEDGETILLDAGTTTFELALLLRERRSLTVVTNSIPIALALTENESLEVMLVGGRVQPRRLAALGPLAVRYLGSFRVDKAFLSFNGVDAEAGFTVVDFEAAEAKERMMDCARETIVLADSAKVGRVAFARVAPASSAHLLITDDEIRGEDSRSLVEAGLPVRIAPTVEETHVRRENPTAATRRRSAR